MQCLNDIQCDLLTSFEDWIVHLENKISNWLDNIKCFVCRCVEQWKHLNSSSLKKKQCQLWLD